MSPTSAWTTPEASSRATLARAARCISSSLSWIPSSTARTSGPIRTSAAPRRATDIGSRPIAPILRLPTARTASIGGRPSRRRARFSSPRRAVRSRSSLLAGASGRPWPKRRRTARGAASWSSLAARRLRPGRRRPGRRARASRSTGGTLPARPQHTSAGRRRAGERCRGRGPSVPSGTPPSTRSRSRTRVCDASASSSATSPSRRSRSFSGLGDRASSSGASTGPRNPERPRPSWDPPGRARRCC
mmetsp:Transcript_13920/g.41456  ORF Transcript_13920/g.41456 Transcript_13920/m.41456 type:complete len:246 (-) Transcript_13920:1815-2552(-)